MKKLCYDGSNVPRPVNENDSHPHYDLRTILICIIVRIVVDYEHSVHSVSTLYESRDCNLLELLIVSTLQRVGAKVNKRSHTVTKSISPIGKNFIP